MQGQKAGRLVRPGKRASRAFRGQQDFAATNSASLLLQRLAAISLFVVYTTDLAGQKALTNQAAE